MLFWENILQALAAVRANALRSALTIVIIALGIGAIVAVLTAIDGIKYYFSTSFATLGSNSFRIENREANIQIGGGGNIQRKRFPPITLAQAAELKRRLSDRSIISVTGWGTSTAARYQNLTTNPNITVRGVDEDFAIVNSAEIVEGRSFSADDVANRRPVAVVGNEIKVKLFPSTTPIGKDIVVGKNRYRIIGLLKEKGSGFGPSLDKSVYIPVSTLLSDYPNGGRSFSIGVYVSNPIEMPAIEAEAEANFRLIRELKPADDNNFSFLKSDAFVEQLMSSLSILTLSATLISCITLFGASIGLMNIMLVSVTERTREIGVRKALGASKKAIRLQFLTEAITICQLGGLAGILFGMLLGNVIGLLIGSAFIVPWTWIIGSVAVCFIVGIASGYYPANRAAALDPIEALRYE